MKQSYDKAFRDKAFQVDMLHTDKSTPSPPGSQTDEQLKSPFEAQKLRQLEVCIIITTLLRVFMFVLFLPSNSRVCLVNQRDGQIQTVVREFVLGIGATTNKE